ncbi:hypothetical protein COV81_02540 [Candidatus Peregrinibacteria bacterium CG11_big_fil_rev_8_21_14_0_20_41_10]|nr:MAG: hypothetical protein COV81_02540 [Candidatus Peregrinibacteria bacterium CG11_big_fil_rev_8_21_14_0_20_41_10]PIZ77769.1 MAG: hypothetical protein COY06_00240 [Candidatus Peregrinibacteria bacterium CG_4_10_14_0_2_um_filter_41_8]
MRIDLSRILFGLVIGGLLTLIAFFAFFDFSVIDNAGDDPLLGADYLRLQADYKDGLAKRKIGKDDAPIKMTLYTDFACEGCRDFYQQVLPWLRYSMIEDGIVNLEVKFYPVLSQHPESLVASQAALCAAEQSDFYTYHNLLFDNQDNWKQNVALDDYLIDLASRNRYKETVFRKCLLSGKYEQFVKLELSDAIGKGIKGAPTAVLQKDDKVKIIEGGVSAKLYEQAINALLEDPKEETKEEAKDEPAA